MEEKVKDIYENIKDRLSNPLIFSFLCSWLVLNWKIPVALIWYDKSQFSGCGCHTIFDFIDWQWENNGTFKWPVIIAFIYTAAIPFVKNGVRIISAKAQKWGEAQEIKILDGGKIGIDKYLELREDYKNKIKDLEDIANEEKKYLDENGRLLMRINELTTEKNKLQDDLVSISDYDFFDGQWNWKRTFSLRDENGINIFDEKRVLISKRKWYFLNSQGNRQDAEFAIQDFYLNKNNNTLIFIRVMLKNSTDNENKFYNTHFVNVLSLTNGSRDYLVGKENGESVEFERLP